MHASLAPEKELPQLVSVPHYSAEPLMSSGRLARTEHKNPPSPGEFLFSCLSSLWRQSGWSLFFYNKVMAIAFFLSFFFFLL